MAPRFLKNLTKPRRNSKIYPDELNAAKMIHNLPSPIGEISLTATKESLRSSCGTASIRRKRKIFSSINSAVKRVMTGLFRLSTRDIEKDSDLEVTHYRDASSQAMMERTIEQELQYQAAKLDEMFEKLVKEFEELSDEQAETAIMPEGLMYAVMEFERLLGLNGIVPKAKNNEGIMNEASFIVNGEETMKCKVKENKAMEIPPKEITCFVDENSMLQGQEAEDTTVVFVNPKFERSSQEIPKLYANSKIKPEIDIKHLEEISTPSEEELKRFLLGSSYEGNQEDHTKITNEQMSQEETGKSILPLDLNLKSSNMNIEDLFQLDDPCESEGCTINSDSHESLMLTNLFKSQGSINASEHFDSNKSGTSSIRCRGKKISHLIAVFENASTDQNQFFGCKRRVNSYNSI